MSYFTPPPTAPGNRQRRESSAFVFLSVFKWEWRKGWDVLLLSYWKAFHNHELEQDVVLRIKTYRPPVGLLADVYMESGPAEVRDEIAQFAQGMLGSSIDELPRVEIISEHMSRAELRKLYHKANAFVLPTRGEGWGLPVVEAMASGLPVIVTNFSGPSSYLTELNSYPIPVQMVDEQGFAHPSVPGLVEHLRACVGDREAARRRGAQGRVDMVKKYSTEAVGRVFYEELVRLSGRLL